MTQRGTESIEAYNSNHVICKCGHMNSSHNYAAACRRKGCKCDGFVALKIDGKKVIAR